MNYVSLEKIAHSCEIALRAARLDDVRVLIDEPGESVDLGEYGVSILYSVLGKNVYTGEIQVPGYMVIRWVYDPSSRHTGPNWLDELVGNYESAGEAVFNAVLEIHRQAIEDALVADGYNEMLKGENGHE